MRGGFDFQRVSLTIVQYPRDIYRFSRLKPGVQLSSQGQTVRIIAELVFIVGVRVSPAAVTVEIKRLSWGR